MVTDNAHEQSRLEMIDSAVLRGHVIVDVPIEDDQGNAPTYAPGVYARCYKCNATLRYYQGKYIGEASLTWCPIQ